MVTTSPVAPVLTEQLIRRCGERAPTYDRENRFFAEDFEELRNKPRHQVTDTGGQDPWPVSAFLCRRWI